ncbi:cytochrome P450 4F6-like [Diadema setosum]|uniref:cytochrome P450 4F6-like n=1 Tax=Diadema setosum TaxID=31175 RepID=UPI003B3A5072
MFPNTIFVAFPLLVFIIYSLFKRARKWVRFYRRVSYIRRHFPGPTPHWFWGNALDKPGLFDPGLEWHLRAASKYRRVLVFWGLWHPCVILNHPDTLREILKSTTASVKSVGYQLFSDWLGQGLACSDGVLWRRHRRLITPSFHFNSLKRYVPIVNKVTTTLLGRLSVIADSDTPLETHHMMTRCSADAILQTAFSYESRCQERESPILAATRTLTDIGTSRMLNPIMACYSIFRLSPVYGIWKDAVQKVNGLGERLIRERRAKLMESEEKTGVATDTREMDFLDSLLLARDAFGDGLSDAEIRDEVNTFIFAGLDTTSSAVTWLLLDMAKYPEHQARVQAEVDDVMAGKESEYISGEDLQKFKFLQMCMRESLRLHAVFMPARTLLEPLTVDGLTIPPRTSVMLNFYQLHHNPDVWGDDHMVFRPERFARERVEARDPFAFVPFSAGPHNCIGQQFAMQEIQIVVARVLRHFSVGLLRESRPVFSVVGKPKDDVILSIKRRESAPAGNL